MSRSEKHNPAGGVTTARSEKDDKKTWHSTLRSKTRSAMKHLAKDADNEEAAIDAPDLIPDRKEVSNPWSMSKDGKIYYGESRSGEEDKKTTRNKRRISDFRRRREARKRGTADAQDDKTQGNKE